MIQKTKVKKMFNDAGIQCSVKTLNVIEDYLRRKVDRMVANCVDGKIKRLTPELFWVAMGDRTILNDGRRR
tara:strand:+ start:194 stop:406 length:213 start_codon:yes stop_codon:yes gene_type:complete